jgi:hypothetical protein
MASENRPGVIVVQELQETPAAVAAPTLNPVVVAPCYQIIEAIDSTGALNGDAEYTTQDYSQAALSITQAEFPDPRNNIDEIDVDETQVGARLYYGGVLTTLPRGSNGETGSAFLKSVNEARRAVVVFNSGSTTFGFGTSTLLLNIKANSANNTGATVVELTGTMTPAEVVEALSGVSGITATAYSDLSEYDSGQGTDAGVVVKSRVFGAASSLFLTGSALPVLTAGASAPLSASTNYRIEGPGFRGQDDSDGDLTTPWIEFYVGNMGGIGGTGQVAHFEDKDGVVTTTTPSALSFTGASADIPLKAATATTDGDEFWADGSQVGSAVVTAVEPARFKLGVLNSSRSTFDSSGELVSAVYTTVEVNTPANLVPFAPVYAYFIANNLVWGETTTTPAAAELEGIDTYAIDALPAQLVGDAFTDFTTPLTGGTLAFRVVEDGVTQDVVTHTFTSSAASATTAVASLNGDSSLSNLSFSVGTESAGDKIIMVATVKSGADQSVTVVTSSATVATTLGFAVGDSASGVDTEIATAAAAETDNVDYIVPASVGAETLTLTITGLASGDAIVVLPEVTTTISSTLQEIAKALASVSVAADSYPIYLENDSNLAQVATLTVVDSSGVAVGSASTEQHGHFVFTLVEGGDGKDITITSSGATVFPLTVAPIGAGVSRFSGETLEFTLDENPQTFSVDFTSDSLSDAIDAINEEVGGAVDIASESSNKLVLTSAFSGAASKVEVDSTSSAYAYLFSRDSAEGEGRPNPSFYLDGSGTAHISPNVLRNRSNGLPLDLSASGAAVYIDYVGLRLDVTSSASEPALLSFEDVDTMVAAIGPISLENPLALACFLMLQNAPSQSVSALGISAVNDAAPMGTTTAHLSALTFLESKDVYAIAPMTDDPFVQQLYSAHVESMSSPEERGERIAFIWQGQPSREQDTSIQTGADATVNGSENTIVLGSTPVEGLAALGLDPAELEISDNVYLELVVETLGQTNVYKFSVSAVNTTALTLRASFASTENTDGFFDTPDLDWSDDSTLSGMTYVLKQRGDRLLITGTTLPDYASIATTAAAQGSSYNSRRTFMVYCDNADTSIDGVVTPVPGYYTTAAIAGMVAEQAPQQPFTRVSMTGFSKVYGTDDTFSENQMDTIADGGRYILINQGGRIASRHQRSTKSTSIEARELSITKAIDFLAKGLRATNRVYIGRYVINPGFIDQLVMSNEGFLARTVQAGVVNSASLNSVLQDSSAPDTVLIEVTVAPAYPCNKIRITIVS